MNITIKYGLTTVAREYPTAPTISQIIGDANLRAVFGWGDNLRALIMGVEQTGGVVVPSGATVVVETKCNTKACPITVKYGLQSIEKHYDDDDLPSVGEVKDDANLRAVFGWGDNVRVLIGGVEQPDHVVVPVGATLVVETAANTKAA